MKEKLKKILMWALITLIILTLSAFIITLIFKGSFIFLMGWFLKFYVLILIIGLLIHFIIYLFKKKFYKFIFNKKVMLSIAILAVLVIITSFIPVKETTCYVEGLPEPKCSEKEVTGLGFPRIIGNHQADDVLYLKFSWLNLIINIILYGVIPYLGIYFIKRK